jgi:GT2 family glycosyltransferase
MHDWIGARLCCTDVPAQWLLMNDQAFLAPTPPPAHHGAARPAFSVVIAAWRAAATVGEAVASALQQTSPAAEVIVCDDGSPDDVAGALASVRGRVRLIRHAHAGAAAARNAAARLASGDFIVVLDADDVWLPERLERLGDLAAARPDLDVLTTDAWFEVDGHRAGRFYAQPRYFPIADQATEILRRNFVMGHAAVRQPSWWRVGGFDETVRIGEDWDFWLRLLFAGAQVGCVDEPLAIYRIHSGSLSDDRPASLRARVALLDRAAARSDLTPALRRVLRDSRRGHLRRALLAEAEAALAAGQPGARGRAIGVLTGPGMPVTTRLRALAAAAAPGRAGRMLRRRHALAGGPGYERQGYGA